MRSKEWVAREKVARQMQEMNRRREKKKKNLMAEKSGLYRKDKLRVRKVKSQAWKELDW